MYDLIIIGAGPAGLTASVYSSRYKMNHLVIGDPFGSSLAKAHMIENWPGEKSIKGSDLLMKFLEHAQGLGGEILFDNAVSVKKEGEIFKVRTSTDKVFESKSVVLCSGTKERKLGVPGETEFLGRGVSYCAVCDGAFFKGKTVAVVGGGNSAVMAALMLSEHSEKVYLIHRKDTFRSEPVMLERINESPKIETIVNANIAEIKGNGKVSGIVLDTEYKGSNELALDGVFVEVGLTPNSVLLGDLGVETDAQGHIVVDVGGATNVEGLYAAGDVSAGSNGIRQILSASSEGMVSVSSIYNFLKTKQGTK